MAIVIKKKGAAELKPAPLAEPARPTPEEERAFRDRIPVANKTPRVKCAYCDDMLLKPCDSDAMSNLCLNRHWKEGKPWARRIGAPTGGAELAKREAEKKAKPKK